MALPLIAAIIAAPAVLAAGVAVVDDWIWGTENRALPAPPAPPAPGVPSGGYSGAVTRPGAVDEVIVASTRAARDRNLEFFSDQAAAFDGRQTSDVVLVGLVAGVGLLGWSLLKGSNR